IVETVEQAMALEVVEVEGNRAAIGTVNFLGFEIDGEGCIGAARSVVHQLVQLFLSDLDRQDAVPEAVIVEDVGERGRDDAAGTEIKQAPRRMLARGTAADIVACNQNLSVAVAGLVQDEIRVLRTVFIEAHFGEKSLAQTRALDRLQVI